MLGKLLALLALAVALPSCACLQAEHRNDPQCAIVNQIVDCTEDAVRLLGPQFLPLVKAVIAKARGADGAIDWAQVEQALIGLGVKDGGCILANLENDYITKPTASPTYAAEAKSYHDGFASYRARRWPNVKFKVIGPDGKTVLR